MTTMSPSPITAPVLTEPEVAQFHQDGFLALDRITSPEEVALIRQTIEALFASKAGYEEGARYQFTGLEDDPDDPGIPQIIWPRHYAASLGKTEFEKNALAVARQLLGPEARLNYEHALQKPALNGPASPWHQDAAFRDLDVTYEDVSIWMPLQPVDQVNGCMAFIPSTHRGEILPHRSPNDDPRIHAVECYAGFDPQAAVVCPLPAGGCTIHHGRTLHGAGPNRSPAPRYAYVLNFSTPPARIPKPPTFAWLQKKNTPHTQRRQTWKRRGGFLVENWRVFRKTSPKDYWKIFPKLKRKALQLVSLPRKR